MRPRFIFLDKGRLINLDRIAYIHEDNADLGMWCASVSGHDDDYIPLSPADYISIVAALTPELPEGE